MIKKVLFIILVMGLTCPAWSTIVTPTVENYGFEDAGTELVSWEEVPGWSSDIIALNSGVKADTTATEGSFTAYLFNGDPSVYNLTDYITQLDNEYVLELDARNDSTGSDPAMLEISLFLDVYGDRVTVISKTVELTDSWTTFSLDYYSDTLPAVYNKIGIELANVTPSGQSSISVDNVRFVPEPATIALLGFGSIVLLNTRKNKFSK